MICRPATGARNRTTLYHSTDSPRDTSVQAHLETIPGTPQPAATPALPSMGNQDGEDGWRPFPPTQRDGEAASDAADHAPGGIGRRGPGGPLAADHVQDHLQALQRPHRRCLMLSSFHTLHP